MAEFTGVFHLDFTLFFLHNALESGTMHVDRNSGMQRLRCTMIEKAGQDLQQDYGSHSGHTLAVWPGNMRQALLRGWQTCHDGKDRESLHGRKGRILCEKNHI
ncbi:MAG: hypothetical protein LUH20_01335 [Lachnospiraceae bacterium]|nr:hypothetical protein [Lachnospiraceae bacterium]